MKKLTSLPRSIAISIAIFFLIVYLIVISSIPVLAEDAGFALNFDGSNDYVILGDTGDILIPPVGRLEKQSASGLTPPVRLRQKQI